jgi:glycosyltransferase involved in cell wall biosynthesis
MHVAMIIQSYHPRIGGAERIVADLAGWLTSRGDEVNVVTRRYPGMARFDVVNGVPVHRLPVPGPRAMAALTFTMAALPLLLQLRPNILHAHELLSPTTTAIAAKRVLRVPIVATAHRSGPPGDVQMVRSVAFSGARFALMRKHVDAFIMISQDIFTELTQVGISQARCHFIPNGVDTGRFAPVMAQEKPALRAKLGLSEKAPVAVYAGRLMPEKRVDNLVAIWPAVRVAYPEAELVVMGTGPEEARLRQAAGEGVRFAGRIDDVVPYLQAADLFVLPSAAEGLSVALLEALSVGLPVVITSVGGARDVVTHGDNGWLVPPDDLPALQQAVCTLLGDVALRVGLGCRGRERVIARFSLPAVSQQTSNLYATLLTQPWRWAYE